jgi:hypothetical protein
VKRRGARSRERCRARGEPGDLHVRSILHPPELLALCPTQVAQQHQAQNACFAEVPRRPTMGPRVIARHGYLWAATASTLGKVRDRRPDGCGPVGIGSAGRGDQSRCHRVQGAPFVVQRVSLGELPRTISGAAAGRARTRRRQGVEAVGSGVTKVAVGDHVAMSYGSSGDAFGVTPGNCGCATTSMPATSGVVGPMDRRRLRWRGERSIRTSSVSRASRLFPSPLSGTRCGSIPTCGGA